MEREAGSRVVVPRVILVSSLCLRLLFHLFAFPKRETVEVGTPSQVVHSCGLPLSRVVLLRPLIRYQQQERPLHTV